LPSAGVQSRTWIASNTLYDEERSVDFSTLCEQSVCFFYFIGVLVFFSVHSWTNYYNFFLFCFLFLLGLHPACSTLRNHNFTILHSVKRNCIYFILFYFIFYFILCYFLKALWNCLLQMSFFYLESSDFILIWTY
jgi:hypothetical protein